MVEPGKCLWTYEQLDDWPVVVLAPLSYNEATIMSIRKKLGFAFVFIAFLSVFPTSSASADEGRYFVKSTKSFWKNALGVRNQFENGFTTDLSDFQVRFDRILGLEIEPVKTLQILPDSVTLTPSPSQDLKSKVNDYKNNLTPEDIITSFPSVSRNKINRTPTRIVPSDQTPWGIETIYNDSSITRTSGGAGVKVAILDTGALTTHPDLKQRVIQCKDFTNLRFPVVDGKCDDKNGHGTHIAGIVAADGGADGKGIYGVAPAAGLMIYKVCGSNGLCYSDDIAAAIRLAADQGANVINMSFGADSPIDLINDALNYAISKNVLPIAAAGNDGPFDNSIDYPAAYATVIGVGAVNQLKQVTSWSSRGNNTSTTPYVVERGDIEFATPGENIESTYNNGGYAILSGTSMASPFAAGLAAKFWQSTAVNPTQATRDFLHSLAIDLLPTGDDNASGFGLPEVPASPSL